MVVLMMMMQLMMMILMVMVLMMMMRTMTMMIMMKTMMVSSVHETKSNISQAPTCKFLLGGGCDLRPEGTVKTLIYRRSSLKKRV